VIGLTGEDGEEIRGRTRRDILRRYATRRHRLYSEPERRRPPRRPLQSLSKETHS
jgi:hypothetical protein